jgi:Rrf2 family protein
MISKKMKYGLKALIEIINSKDELISAHLIAEKANIPLKFLEHILTELRKGRLINSKKGSSGGYYLLKKAEEISIADVYRIIDGPIAWVPCASLNFYEKCTDCVDEETCKIHFASIHLRDETLKVLEGTNLADVANNKFGKP